MYICQINTEISYLLYLHDILNIENRYNFYKKAFKLKIKLNFKCFK